MFQRATLPWLLLICLPVSLASSCENECCPGKKVGDEDYTFSHHTTPEEAHNAGCSDQCVYTRDSDDMSNNVCFKSGDQSSKCTCASLPHAPKQYCQPGDPCWPTRADLENFTEQINGNNLSCLRLKKFVNVNDQSAHEQICLPYTGLQVDTTPGTCPSPVNSDPYLPPDPSCAPNPFVTGARYNDSDNQFACMTPYQFLNNRNFKLEWMAAFVVTAHSKEDISAAVKFARKHNLSISVISTGHDLQDRNAGPSPNSLLIRTTCFREWTPTDETVDTGIGSKCTTGPVWKDGYAKVGAGLTFGRNFWWKLENAKGTYELAADFHRETVGGTCRSVGIVGWTMGGGRGWTSPKYGLGVDQLIHVDFVAADGSFQSANHSHNSDLFYAIRGGGGGFAIIHKLHIKLHKPSPSCNGSMKGCYTMHSLTWTGTYSESTVAYIKKILLAYAAWSLENRSSWNSIVQLFYGMPDNKPNQFTLNISANQFGHVDPYSFDEAMANFKTDLKTNLTTITDKYWCEVFPDSNNGNNCTDIPWTVSRLLQSIRFLVNGTVITNASSDGFLDKMLSTWQPACANSPHSICASGFQIHGDLPDINKTTNKGVHDCGGPVSNGFRTSSFQVFNYSPRSAGRNLTFVQQEEWMRFGLGPVLYPYSTNSYFNEVEYTLPPGQWERRFWGTEAHCRLQRTKRKYDPEQAFGCRHCIGDEVGYDPTK